MAIGTGHGALPRKPAVWFTQTKNCPAISSTGPDPNISEFLSKSSAQPKIFFVNMGSKVVFLIGNKRILCTPLHAHTCRLMMQLKLVQTCINIIFHILADATWDIHKMHTATCIYMNIHTRYAQSCMYFCMYAKCMCMYAKCMCMCVHICACIFAAKSAGSIDTYTSEEFLRKCTHLLWFLAAKPSLWACIFMCILLRTSHYAHHKWWL